MRFAGRSLAQGARHEARHFPPFFPDFTVRHGDLTRTRRMARTHHRRRLLDRRLTCFLARHQGRSSEATARTSAVHSRNSPA